MEENMIKDLERIIKENKNGDVITIKDRVFVVDDNRLREIEDKEYLINDYVGLTDLKSFCEIIKEEIGKINETLFVQIVNPTYVKAYTSLDAKKRRECPYVCNASIPRLDVIDNWNDYERFVIGIRANFAPSDDATDVVKLIANIVKVDDQELVDDGISQSVRTQRGSQYGTQEAKSIVKLAPFRTFAEVDQPISEFLFRMKDNGSRFGLFEADGGRWEIEAKKNIANYINKELDVMGVDRSKVKILF